MTKETIIKMRELIKFYDNAPNINRKIDYAERLADFISERQHAIISALELTIP